MATKKIINIRIYERIDAIVKKVAKSLGFNRSEYIRELIMKDLRKLGLISDEIKKELESSGVKVAE